MTPKQAEKLQRKFVRERRKWAREINHPIKGYEAEPDPGVIDALDHEEG
jgi:hypothetical protein